VVNVLELTTNNVSAGSRSPVASRRSAPSTLDTNRKTRVRSESALRASYAMAGPRSDPPMPMLTTFRTGLPVWPFHSPDRTRLDTVAIRSSTAWTCFTTSSPSTTMDRSAGARSAT
jgi:hypothetical protein